MKIPAQTVPPSKEKTRAYMQARQAAKSPPPTRDEVRRQMGWELK